MGPRVFDHKEMAARIMDDGDVDGAIKHVLGMLSGKDNKTKYSTFRNIRAHIIDPKRAINSYEKWRCARTSTPLIDHFSRPFFLSRFIL
jgi:hypothetical protein